ncbi:MAG: tyrosine-type recombinase/integrase [Desulfobacterales bacterium]
MSVYSKRGKGWRYDFTHKAVRHTEAWFKTKREAMQAEAKKREEVENPRPETETPIDMDFLTLVNRRLDYVQASCAKGHFKVVLYHSRRWVKRWNGLKCNGITCTMIEDWVIKRSRVSAIVANKELQYLRALFNYGVERNIISDNPTNKMGFLPVDKRKKYIPPKGDVTKVISGADLDTQHYLWTIVSTAGRVNEINNLTWDDVSFTDRYITLWTRKRKNGNREPREIPMVPKLYNILHYRYQQRDVTIPWVFWHEYWCRKNRKWIKAPFKDRKKIMGTLCRSANVKYFRYHPIRHLTASVLDNMGVSIGVIQRILGHQNRKTTEIYLHSVGDAERKAMNKLQEVDVFSKMEPALLEGPINKSRPTWQRRVNRPPFEILKAEIEQLGYTAVGRKYGVSDNAVRKWMKAYSEPKG